MFKYKQQFMDEFIGFCVLMFYGIIFNELDIIYSLAFAILGIRVITLIFKGTGDFLFSVIGETEIKGFSLLKILHLILDFLYYSAIGLLSITIISESIAIVILIIITHIAPTIFRKLQALFSKTKNDSETS